MCVYSIYKNNVSFAVLSLILNLIDAYCPRSYIKYIIIPLVLCYFYTLNTKTVTSRVQI